MQLTSHNFSNGEKIPGECAFAVPDAASHITFSSNRNPQLAWSDVPAGTQSFVLICHDTDVPSKADDVNQEGRTISASLPRVDFYHWLLLDIPADVHEIAEGSFSRSVTVKGKSGPQAENGWRQGINDFTGFLAGDAEMKGTYYGYDGPCPPWNDTIVHHYIFTVYAIDVPRLAIEGELNGTNVLAALDKVNVLARASVMGLYSLNPDVINA